MGPDYQEDYADGGIYAQEEEKEDGPPGERKKVRDCCNCAQSAARARARAHTLWGYAGLLLTT